VTGCGRLRQYNQPRPAAAIAAQLPLRPEELIAQFERRLSGGRAAWASGMEEQRQRPELAELGQLPLEESRQSSKTRQQTGKLSKYECPDMPWSVTRKLTFLLAPQAWRRNASTSSRVGLPPRPPGLVHLIAAAAPAKRSASSGALPAASSSANAP
jgi:hypothetical protein